MFPIREIRRCSAGPRFALRCTHFFTVAASVATALILAATMSTHASDISGQIDELVEAYHRYRGFEGVVLVADGGEVVYKGACGWANREWRIPNTVETRFLISSVTKPFTAALSVILYEHGLIDLQAPISMYLPEFRKDIGERVTVHHLLTHTSGIPNYAVYPAFWDENPPRMKYDHAEFIRKFCSGNLEFAPGSQAHYSDANYYLLATISEKVSGLSFEEALKKWIFDPLEMKNSGVVLEDRIIDWRAYGYLLERGEYRIPPHINYEDTQLGAGDMYSTVEDMFKFDQALYGDQLMSRRATASLFEKHAESGFANMHNGYGWNIGLDTLRDSKTVVRIAHAPGNNNGFTTVLFRVPETKRTVIIAQNTGPGWLDMKVFRMSREIIHLLYGENYDIPKPSIVEKLTKTLKTQGIKTADAEYTRLAISGQYDLDEGGINRLGYKLLAEGQLDEAVAVFRWNVQSYSESANAYDSLGEAHMAQGDRAQAIENYRKSLALNPSNDNARQMLKRLVVR